MRLSAQVAMLEARLQSLEDEAGDGPAAAPNLGPEDLGGDDFYDGCMANGRRTVGYNPLEDGHKGEIAMWASWVEWGVAGGWPKIPYLAKNEDKVGSLQWASPDADEQGYGSGPSKSLQIVTGTGSMQVFGFSAAADGAVAWKSSGILSWLTRGDPLPAQCDAGDGAAGTQGIAFADHKHKIIAAASAASCQYADSAATATYAQGAGSVIGFSAKRVADLSPDDRVMTED